MNVNVFIPNDITVKAMRKEFDRMRRFAEFRGVEWLLTIDQFMQIWTPYWRDRHRKLVLMRRSFLEPWRIDNVLIASRSDQLRAQHRFMKGLGLPRYNHPKTQKQLHQSEELKDCDPPLVMPIDYQRPK